MAEKISLIGTKYYVTAVLPDGRLIHLENVAENIAWEENESELAVRLNLTIRDEKEARDFQGHHLGMGTFRNKGRRDNNHMLRHALLFAEIVR